MNRSYISHNTVINYYKIIIRTNHPMPENQTHHVVFKAKTVQAAIKAAHRYCAKQNLVKSYYSYVDDVLYQCDYWGRQL